jgi:serine/threonine protein kinase
VTGSQSNPRHSYAAVTTPAGMAGVCTRCGATLIPSNTSCARCGATVTGPGGAEHAERIRLRLQESVGDAYRLIEMLGRGGMGIVFRAHETALDREVALKVLALDPVLSPEAYARFEREAKLAARLDHPHIVPIFAVGQRNTVAFYTMRLVRGGTLEDMLAGHTMIDVEHALEILRDVAKAMDYAHGQGVVHRDIKPANVLIGDSGHAMVSDFGIAKALGSGEAPVGSGTGIIGSPGYMSPEQWRGEDIDAKADQYALGVMAFEMLTGHRPFETVKVQDLVKLHLSADVPKASALRAGLEPHVDAAIQRAMAKNAADRFPSATAFIDALAGRRPVGLTRASVTAIRTAPAPPPPTRHGFLIAAGLVVVAAAALAMVFALTRDDPTAQGELPHHHRHYLKPVKVVAPAPDSSLTPVDTTFDLNATNEPNVHRRPVAIDPSLGGGTIARGSDGPAYVRIVARGGAAKVRLDGRTLGFTPLVVRVDAGSHYVSLESAGDAFLPDHLNVEATANDTVNAVFMAAGLRPDTAAPGTSLPASSAQSP